MNRFDNKVAIVTGGAGGIGQAICRRLATEGAKVICIDINVQALDGFREECQAQHLDIDTRPMDVTDPAAWTQTLSELVSRFGHIDLAVNNAGMGGDITPMADYPLDTWDQVVSLNINSVFYGMRAQIPHMLSQGYGAIVNTASIMATVAMPGISPYVASKHAVLGLTKGAAVDYGDQGIRVNAVGPSFIRTGFTAEALSDDAVWKDLASRHALQKTAEPDDIAAMVAFLGSDDARFITGNLYTVDGGYTSM